MNNKVTFSQLNILILLFSCSCANDVYYPPMINVPVFTGKKQAKININLRNIQAAVTLKDNLGLNYNYAFSYFIDSDGFFDREWIEIIKSHNNEVGFFYFNIIKPWYFFSSFGSGIGFFSYKYKFDDTSPPDETTNWYPFQYVKEISGYYYKMFILPALGLKLNNHEIIFGFKLSGNNFFLNGFEIKDSSAQGNLLNIFHSDFSSKTNYTILEPMITYKYNYSFDELGFFIQPRASLPFVHELLKEPFTNHYYHTFAEGDIISNARFILTFGIELHVWNSKKMMSE